MTGTISGVGDNSIQRKQKLSAATQAAFKNCACFKICSTEINDIFVD